MERTFPYSFSRIPNYRKTFCFCFENTHRNRNQEFVSFLCDSNAIGKKEKTNLGPICIQLAKTLIASHFITSDNILIEWREFWFMVNPRMMRAQTNDQAWRVFLDILPSFHLTFKRDFLKNRKKCCTWRRNVLQIFKKSWILEFGKGDASFLVNHWTPVFGCNPNWSDRSCHSIQVNHSVIVVAWYHPDVLQTRKLGELMNNMFLLF